MEIRRLLSTISGTVSWDLLRLFQDGWYNSEDLADRLDVTRSTVRSHLERLRDAGFVEVKEEHRPKKYGAAGELPGPVHELVQVLLSLDKSTNIYDPEEVRKQLQSVREEREDVDWIDPLIQALKAHYPRPNPHVDG